MSTSRRIQVGILVTVFVVMALCGASVLYLVRAELVGRLDDQLETGAETFQRIGDPDAAIEVVETLRSQPDRESAVLVFGDDGELVASVVQESLMRDVGPRTD